MKTITIDDKKIQISDESYEAFKKQFASNYKAMLWKPEDGWYWFVNSAGVSQSDYWKSDGCDQHRYETGNVFKTEEEAQQALDTGWVAKRKAEVKILRFIAENDLEFEPDWKNDSSAKYYIYYDYADGIFKANYWFRVQESSNFYFKSEADAQKVIDAMTPELEILFGVIN